MPTQDRRIYSPSDSSLSLWAVFRRRFNWLVGGTLVGGLVATFYALSTPEVYESESEVLVIDKDDANLAKHSVDAQFGDELLATHLRIMSSRRIVADAIASRDLMQLPGLRKGLREFIHQQPTELDAATTYILENLTVKQGGEGRAKGAQVLRPIFQHNSPGESQQILAAVVTSYQRFVNDEVYGADDEAASLISRASDEIEKKVSSLEAAYREFREQAPILWRKDGTTVNPHEIRLSDIEQKLSQIRLKRAEVASRLQVVESDLARSEDDDDADLQRLSVIDSSDIGRLSLLLEAETGHPLSEQFQAAQPLRVETASAEFDRLLALVLEVEKHRISHGPQHPKVMELENQINQLRSFLKNRDALPTVEDLKQGVAIQRLAETYARLLTYDLADFEREEQSLTGLADFERDRAKDLLALELQEESLRKAADRAKALHNSVVERLDEINLLKDHGGFISQVINPVREGQLTWPKIPLVLALGTLLGTFAGCGLAVSAELKDHSFKSPNDMVSETDLPMLAQIPWFLPAKTTVVNSYDRRLAVLHDPSSREADAVRTLRSAIYTYVPNRSVIQLSSFGERRGNSTVISNLSAAIAKAAQKVLLIDANFRSPGLHKLFSMDNDIGLSSMLMGEASEIEAVRDSLVENLSIITSGPDCANLAELLATPMLSQLLNSVREEYDFILIDAPPLSFSDSISIASHSDFLMINIVPDKDKKEAVSASLARFSTAVRTPILGVVVNKADSDWIAEYASGQYEPLTQDSNLLKRNRIINSYDDALNLNGSRQRIGQEK